MARGSPLHMCQRQRLAPGKSGVNRCGSQSTLMREPALRVNVSRGGRNGCRRASWPATARSRRPLRAGPACLRGPQNGPRCEMGSVMYLYCQPRISRCAELARPWAKAEHQARQPGRAPAACSHARTSASDWPPAAAQHPRARGPRLEMPPWRGGISSAGRQWPRRGFGLGSEDDGVAERLFEPDADGATAADEHQDEIAHHRRRARHGSGG